MREENGEEMESISPSYISPERDQRTHDKDISNNFTNFNKKNSMKQSMFWVHFHKPDAILLFLSLNLINYIMNWYFDKT